MVCLYLYAVPGKIELFKNSRGNTFTFQPPEMSNGVITGFVVVIFRDGELGAENVIDLGPFEFCFSPVSSNIPPGTGPVFIQVGSQIYTVHLFSRGIFS